jgi:hypothetical protein
VVLAVDPGAPTPKPPATQTDVEGQAIAAMLAVVRGIVVSAHFVPASVVRQATAVASL